MRAWSRDSWILETCPSRSSTELICERRSGSSVAAVWFAAEEGTLTGVEGLDMLLESGERGRWCRRALRYREGVVCGYARIRLFVSARCRVRYWSQARSRPPPLLYCLCESGNTSCMRVQIGQRSWAESAMGEGGQSSKTCYSASQARHAASEGRLAQNLQLR